MGQTPSGEVQYRYGSTESRSLALASEPGPRCWPQLFVRGACSVRARAPNTECQLSVHDMQRDWGASLTHKGGPLHLIHTRSPSESSPEASPFVRASVPSLTSCCRALPAAASLPHRFPEGGVGGAAAAPAAGAGAAAPAAGNAFASGAAADDDDDLYS